MTYTESLAIGLTLVLAGAGVIASLMAIMDPIIP